MTNDPRRAAGAAARFPAFGLLLIGIGLVALTGWWWPGIPVLLGIAGSMWFWLRGDRHTAFWITIVFVIVPLAIYTMVIAVALLRILLPIALIALGAGLMYGMGVRRGFSRSHRPASAKDAKTIDDDDSGDDGDA